MLSLLLLANLTPIECPKWLPGTNTILPTDVALAPQQELTNRLRCYCEIVKPAEERCKRDTAPEVCMSRTAQWVNENFPNFVPYTNTQNNTPPVRRLRMISIEP